MKNEVVIVSTPVGKRKFFSPNSWRRPSKDVCFTDVVKAGDVLYSKYSRIYANPSENTHFEGYLITKVVKDGVVNLLSLDHRAKTYTHLLIDDRSSPVINWIFGKPLIERMSLEEML